jgi:hypothetical protein
VLVCLLPHALATPHGTTDGRSRCVLCRVTQELDEVLAKIKAKEAEQASGAAGDDELYKKLLLVDKKAVAGNRTNMLNANKSAESRKSTGPDPYSRKRTVEKNYWSTGTDKSQAPVQSEEQETVAEKKVRFSLFVMI